MRKRPPRKGIVTIAFDDAYLDTYKHAIKYLTNLNIKSTVAVPFSFIGKRFENRPVVGLNELKDIVKSGHEIASHTITHSNLLKLNTKDKNAVLKEMYGPKKDLRCLLNYRVSSFVFPYINKNQSKSLRLKTKPYYKSARLTFDRPCFNRIPLKDPCSAVGFAVMKKHSPCLLNKQVDYAEKNKLWLIEVFHLVSKKNTKSAHRPKPYRFFMHINDFEKHIRYILSKDVLVLTQKDAVKTFPTSA